MKNIDCIEKLKSTQTCVLIPTYNNAISLKEVLDGVLNYCDDVIVVNDGSTDDTESILKEYDSQITCVSYPKNKGKGNALKIGFRKAIKLGFMHAITIDSDGQHFPEDLPSFAETIEKTPNSLIMGARNMEQSDVPGKSSYGNRVSSFWYYVNTGYKLTDTQTGYRCYPLKTIKKMRFFTGKFEFEIETIVRLAWRNVKVISIPVKVRYTFENRERITHFRPAKDTIRITLLNILFVLMTAAWFFHVRMIRKLFSKEFYRSLKDEILAKNDSHLKKAFSVGFGAMVGILPIWGFQIAFGLGASWLLKLNKFLVIASSHISIPPMIPFIIYGSFQFGGLFVSNPVDFIWEELTVDYAYQHITQYLIGATMLALLTGFLFFLIVLGFIKLKEKVIPKKIKG